MLLEHGCEQCDALEYLPYGHVVANESGKNFCHHNGMAQIVVFIDGDSLSFSQVWISSFPAPFIVWFWLSCQRSVEHICVGLLPGSIFCSIFICLFLCQ